MDRTFDKTALTGNTVLLTGAGGGIGRETALAFAALGAFVLLTDIDRARGSGQPPPSTCASPKQPIFSTQTCLTRRRWLPSVEKVLAQYGCPDILFHNAAVVVTGQVGAVPFQAWEHSYAVNLRAPILLTSSFLPHMRKTDRDAWSLSPPLEPPPTSMPTRSLKPPKGSFPAVWLRNWRNPHLHLYHRARPGTDPNRRGKHPGGGGPHGPLPRGLLSGTGCPHPFLPRRQDRDLPCLP